jgi:hypothetical protein
MGSAGIHGQTTSRRGTNMKTIQAVALLSLSVGSMAFGQQAVQWKVADGGNGHWYQLRSFDSNSWIAHRDLSAALGGHLATISSVSEDNFVKALIPRSTAWLFGPSIGLVQQTGASEPGGGWGWVTGEPLTYTGWYPGEPNDGPGYGEHWVRFRFTNGVLAWNDVPESAPGGEPLVPTAIVEWSADCNGDGIIDYGQCRDGSLPDYNGNNIPDCCETGTACVVGSYPVQWRVSEGGNGHWYQLAINPATSEHWRWSEAASHATRLGGHLATLTSQSENAGVYSLLGLAESVGVVAWIGLAQSPGSSEPGGGWLWCTNEPVSFLNWKPQSPDDSGCSIPGNHQDFAIIGSGGDIRWDDNGDPTPSCPFGVSYAVIEWSADCNNDGIVDKGQILKGQLADSDNDGIPNFCDCPCDVLRDFNVNGIDLGILLGQWGPTNQFTVTDFNGDGSVDGSDLGQLLAAWGPCPS